MRFRKQVKKAVRVVGRTAGKRWLTKGKKKSLNYNAIIKDVQMLKHLVNIEKKRFDITQSTVVNVGQLFGAGVSGQFASAVTPYPIEGVAQGQRVGNSIKLVSACMDIQFQQQSAAVNNIKVKYYLICRPDNSSTLSPGSTIAQFFEPNPFSGVNDYYSARDPEYFTNFKVIKSGTVTLKQDSITSGMSIVQRRIPLKLNLHLKFNTDSSTTTTKNQLYLLAVASAGDVSASTGVAMQYNIRYYYTDN